mmetsp:Transcript_7003/g.6186  ORF Transcript_7003/g.6186 Transcript_7003/m.6186 type:complete len:616 (-) Transcript_7003:23-1870(-)
MMYKLTLYLLLLLVIFSTKAQEEGLPQEENVEPDTPGINKCDDNLPILSVGDYNITEERDISFYKQRYDIFILAISDSGCEECCHTEVMLNSVHEYITNKSVGYKDLEIPLVRLDYANFHEMVLEDTLNMNRLPKTFLFFKSKFYAFEEVDNDKLFLHFMNRVFYPVVILKTKKDVNNFIKNDVEWEENTPFYKGNYISLEEMLPHYSKITRVIAFVSDKNEFKEELKSLAEDSRDLTIREDLRVAKITNPKIIEEIKRKNKDWFGDMSSNSVVAYVKNFDENQPKIQFYDLNIDSELFKIWMNNVSIEPVEELLGTSMKIISFMHKGMFTAFVNRKSSKTGKESKELIKNLKEIAKHYPHYQFTFTEDKTFKEKKGDLGISWNEEPALAYHNIMHQDKTMVFPRKQPLTKKNLRAFFDACGKGTYDTDDFDLPDKIRNFDKNMKDATKLTVTNVKGFINDLEKDKMVLIFDSSKDFDRGKKITNFFGKAAARFRELELEDKIALGFYDTSLQNLPKVFKEYEDQPVYVFYPADREPLDPINSENFLVQKMMKYIQENAQNKFELPSFHHMSPHEYSQHKLGEKIKAAKVIDLEEKRKRADKDRDARYITVKDDL